MKQQGKVISGIIIVILIAIFSVLNTDQVPINFGFATVSWPLVLVLLVAIFIGALLMFLFATVANYKTKRVLKQQTIQIEELKQKLSRLNHGTRTITATEQAKEKDDERD